MTSGNIRPLYLDYAATTPVHEEVANVVLHYMRHEFGNSGSRMHRFGATAKRAVEDSRRQVAAFLDADPKEVFFTSGATESNNIATLGLLNYGISSGHRHIVTTSIEHKSVLEPINELIRRNFEVTLIDPGPGGRISARDLLSAVRPDTLLVSIMHANNETGIVQPINQIADGLQRSQPVLHVDAAQTYGKLHDGLLNERIDLISLSGHKLHAPKGIGALIVRSQRNVRARLVPIMYGGGQERGLRPGTIPVPLVAALGRASEIAQNQFANRGSQYVTRLNYILELLKSVDYKVVGDRSHALPNILCVSIPGVDAESLFIGLKDYLAFSNGSACSSSSNRRSHVLTAMGMNNDEIDTTVRLSWGYDCDLSRFSEFVRLVSRLQS